MGKSEDSPITRRIGERGRPLEKGSGLKKKKKRSAALGDARGTFSTRKRRGGARLKCVGGLIS